MKYLNKKYSLLGVIMMILLCSCHDEDNYDVCGSTINKVFMTNSSFVQRFQIKHSLFGSQGKPIEVEVPVSCTQRAVGDIYVRLSIDNSYVEIYNEQHNTSYEAVSEDLIQFENRELKIPANSSGSELSAKMYIEEENYSELKDAAYLIPIVIEDASQDTPVSEERKVMYSIITTTVDLNNIDADASQESANVIFIEDRSAWTAELVPLPSTVTGDSSYLFDSDENTSYWFGKPFSFSNTTSDNISLVVDLKEKYDLAGVYLNGIDAGVKVYLSSDNIEWTEMGTVKSENSNVLFYVPFNAQYVKCEFSAWQNMWGRWNCAGKLYEFRAFVKNK